MAKRKEVIKMNLLHRNEIIDLLRSNSDVINDDKGFFQSDIDKEYTKKSNVQQCSVDLHAGQIYIPESEDNDIGGINRPKVGEHILKTGETLLVRTLEKIKLPADIAGICLAPSRITLRGILVTNTGHVDPGYEGHLHFAFINMGKSGYSLRIEDEICTMLLIKLKEKMPLHGPEEMSSKVPVSIANNLPLLSKDFLDVERRSQEIAHEIANAAVKKAKIASVGIPLTITIILAAIALYPHFFSKPWEPAIAKLETRINTIDYCKKIELNINEIDSLEKRILSLEGKVK